MKSILWMLSLATIAALGNTLYAWGQKLTSQPPNPFVFGASALSIAAIAMWLIALSLPHRGAVAFIAHNALPIALAATGYVLLFLGLYFLYRRFGATYYSVYAVIAIGFTSVLLGAVILKEHFSTIHALACTLAAISIALFVHGSATR